MKNLDLKYIKILTYLCIHVYKNMTIIELLSGRGKGGID
jgi:hypothetical protein